MCFATGHLKDAHAHRDDVHLQVALHFDKYGRSDAGLWPNGSRAFWLREVR